MKIPIRPKKFNNSLNLITRTPGIRETILDLYRYFFFFLKLIEKVFLIPSVSIVWKCADFLGIVGTAFGFS